MEHQCGSEAASHSPKPKQYLSQPVLRKEVRPQEGPCQQLSNAVLLVSHLLSLPSTVHTSRERHVGGETGQVPPLQENVTFAGIEPGDLLYDYFYDQELVTKRGKE